MLTFETERSLVARAGLLIAHPGTASDAARTEAAS
jgi:hypothetical protein